MKKLLILGLCLASSTIYADRFYAGLQAGYNTVQIKSDYIPINGVTLNQSTSTKSKGLIGGVFLGYSHCFGNNVYGAVELRYFANNNSRNQNAILITDNNNVTHTILFSHKLKHSYGIAFKPGYYLTTNLLIYADFGYMRSRFGGDSPISFSNGAPTIFNSYSANTNAYTFGGGVEYNLTNDLGLRFEYFHAKYTSYGVQNFPDISFVPHFIPTTDQFNLGFVYSFGNNFIS